MRALSMFHNEKKEIKSAGDIGGVIGSIIAMATV